MRALVWGFRMAQHPFNATPGPSPRRKWSRAEILILAVGILGLVVIVGYWYRSAGAAWDAVEAETDRLDPGWRLHEIEASRKKIPDAENSALQVIAAARQGVGLIPPNSDYWNIFKQLRPNVRLNVQQEEFIRGDLAKIAEPLQSARAIKDMPWGRAPRTETHSPGGFPVRGAYHHQQAEQVAWWLAQDVYLLAQEAQFDQAMASCQAILNAGRALAEEPTWPAHSARTGAQSLANETLQRVLAQG
jgi:hypothetical protein